MLVVDDDLGLQDLTLTTWRRKILSLARHRQLNGSPLGGDFPEGLYDVVRLVARNGEHRRRHYRRVYAFRARVIWAGGVVDDVTRVAGSSLGPVGVISGDRNPNDGGERAPFHLGKMKSSTSALTRSF